MPFTPNEFLDVFAAYNAAWAPAIALLWLATALVGLAWRGWLPRQRLFDALAGNGAVAALLAVNWAWAGIVYHWEFFAAINPIAAVFAAMFVAQAALFWWYAARGRVVFAERDGAWGWFGTALILYGICYPLIAIAEGHAYPRVPTFGVPCPTTLLTVGWLCTVADLPVMLAIIPLVWCGIGGSAATLLGMHVDLALPVAGAALVVRLVRQGAHHGRYKHALRLVHRNG